MRRFIIVLALILACASCSVQNQTRRAERAEYYRVKDSLFWAERKVLDSIRREERKKEGAVEIIAKSTLTSDKAIDIVAKALISADYMISVDKEYGTITTQAISAGMGSYSLYFRFADNTVTGCAFSHMNIGIAMSHIVATNQSVDKITNYGMRGSLNRIAFDSCEKILLAIPNAELIYRKEEE